MSEREVGVEIPVSSDHLDPRVAHRKASHTEGSESWVERCLFWAHMPQNSDQLLHWVLNFRTGPVGGWRRCWHAGSQVGIPGQCPQVVCEERPVCSILRGLIRVLLSLEAGSLHPLRPGLGKQHLNWSQNHMTC